MRSQALSALRGAWKGGGNAFEHYFKGAMADADTRSKPTGPMVDGPVEKGASFVFLSAALRGLFGYIHPSGVHRLNYACCAARRLHPIVHPRLGNAPRRASIAS